MTTQPDLLTLSVATAADHAGQDLADVPDTKWAPLLADLFDAIEAAFIREGQPEATAARMASVAVSAMAFTAGGRVVYIPRGDRLKQAVRDNLMHSLWQRQGVTIEKLAVDFRMSVVHVYRVIERQRKLHLQKSQLRLELPLEGESE